jgi:para-nitrobenzyl esterase
LPVALPSVDGFVLASPVGEALAAGNFEPRPLLLGTNRDEGTLFQSSIFARDVVDEGEYRAALATRFGSDHVDAIVEHYPVASFPSPNRALAEVSGDALFVCPARRTARAAAAHGAPVFRYTFVREPSQPAISDLGVFHSAEIPFVFGIDQFPLGHSGPEGAPLVDAMGHYWTHFAVTGDPNSDGMPSWPAYDATTDAHMVLDLPPSMGTQLKSALCDVWDVTG